ncbi:HEL306Cp [Eremothecium sinecaudum]|uniref:HEL306Cp n=1 Tax=Eremothecium sinecaudum TaxID=45286 RepID=A0A0X8HT61_9SACH|nr:HEL306Cp [Eremothecium sinecaudum]AMD20975.1 HEL306Cp [Eremothecium sinecaudum]
MSIVLNNNLSFSSRQLADVALGGTSGRSAEFLSLDRDRGPSLSTDNDFDSSPEQGLSSDKDSGQDDSHRKRRKAKRLFSKWKHSVKQKLHISEYDQNGVYNHNQGTTTSNQADVQDALSCYYKFKSDESKIEEMFETMMFRNNTESPPVSRDQELRELAPFEIIGEQKLADLRKKLDVFSNCLSALDDDKPWNQISAFNSPPMDMKMPRSAIGGSSSPPELASGISTLDSGPLTDSIEKDSYCQILSGDECGINGSSESIQDAGNASGSSKTSSIVEKIASFVKTPKTSETSPMDSLRMNSPLDSDFEVQRLVIPTFRMKDGKSMDVSNIVEHLKSGTVTERDLLCLASMYTYKENGFMDKSFYDEQGNEADNESAMSSEFEREGHTIGNEEREFFKPSAINDSNDSVKFNKFSCLVIYNASKKCDTGLKPQDIKNSVDKTRPGAAIEADSGYDGDDEDALSNNVTETEGSLHKSILKSKNNDKEYLESQRAVKCDKVSVDEFLEFFDKYENERREGEYVLSLVRDKQLRNYYSKEYFPEIGCQDHPSEARTEFNRSKLATEHNIGRELMHIKTHSGMSECVNCSSDVFVEVN